MELRDFGDIMGLKASTDWERVYREAPGLFQLAVDISQNGLQEPIEIENGQIKDGVHRLFALWLLGYRDKIPVIER